MAIVDRAFQVDDPLAPSVDVEVNSPIDFSGGAEIIPNGMGGVTVQSILGDALNKVDELTPILDHGANLAEHLDDSVLKELASEVTQNYEDDLQSRQEWEEAYAKGLDLLGIKYEERTEPFEGASGVTHPMIMESVTQFQAQAYKELLPSSGPVKTQILGLKSPEAEAQAGRVKDFMNYRITEVMSEYDPGMDQMLFYLPLSGSTFKKVYYDPVRGREASDFIPAQDLVIPYSAVDLDTAPRVTHVLKMQDNDVRKMQLSGAYRDVELGSPESTGTPDQVKEKVDDIDGRSKSFSDDTRTLLECHAELDIEGFEDVDEEGEPTGLKLPYIVTLDKDSNTILSIQRNYDPNDSFKRKRQYFVHYKFMPGLGFYGFGLIHMIGGLGRSATSILRQLIDAGTLANLPAGFKAKGVRVRDSDSPLQPGEWRDIDAPGMDLRNALVPLPYKEPSATLAQLMGALIDDGRRFLSLADSQMSNMQGEAPVGTTVALLERGMKVMSAIHKRLHYAQKTEFRLLARVMKESLPPMYPYAIAGAPAEIMQADFDDRVDIIPVSDPNIFSMSQRVTLAQSELQMAQSAPEIHNLREAYRRMYQALEVQNIEQILPIPPQPQPTDAALEGAAMLTGQGAQAFPNQDHDSHIQSHLAIAKMGLVAMNPMLVAGITAHILQHISFKSQTMAQEQLQQEAMQAYQQQGAQMGGQIGMAAQSGQMPLEAAMGQMMQIPTMIQPQMPTPEQIQSRVSQIQAQLISQLIPMLSPPPPDPGSDPLVAIRMQELALKNQDTQNKAKNDQDRLALDQKKLEQQAVSDSSRLEVQEQVSNDRVQVARERIAAGMMKDQNKGNR
ncbi:hypothetical protein UFOVP1202_65 [uncultured Caudovirales phage]|uniref:Uncharacterized protein n=1 Tax=uncultured Caudovirales phage TaxID=2100421 RepID=A0A6J5RDK3_9CAUD|nr:hypothetical protein UFOVP1202_65 [uncultured Caudovirales phage]